MDDDAVSRARAAQGRRRRAASGNQPRASPSDVAHLRRLQTPSTAYTDRRLAAAGPRACGLLALRTEGGRPPPGGLPARRLAAAARVCRAAGGSRCREPLRENRSGKRALTTPWIAFGHEQKAGASRSTLSIPGMPADQVGSGAARRSAAQHGGGGRGASACLAPPCVPPHPAAYLSIRGWNHMRCHLLVTWRD